MLKESKQGSYTIERTFLGRVTVNEFMGNIIRQHGQKACENAEKNGDGYEKNVEKTSDL